MKKVLTSFLLIAFGIQAFAQSFSISVDTAKTNETVSNIYVGGFYASVATNLKITNHSGVGKLIAWTRKENVLPSGWATSVCDGLGCFGREVSSSEFPLAADTFATLTVDFYPNSAGYAVTTLHVFDKNNPADSINPVFVTSITGTSGVAKVTRVKDVYLSPVPARDVLSVVYDNSLHPTKVEVYTILGQLMRSEKIVNSTSSKVDINVSGLDKGLYFMRLYAAGNNVLTRQFSKD